MILPLVMVAAMALSWYVLLEGKLSGNKEYHALLEEARAKGELGILGRATEAYLQALEIRKSPELYNEVAALYSKHEAWREAERWGEIFLEEYPEEVLAYENMLKLYLEAQDLEAGFDIIQLAEGMSLESAYIRKIKEDLEYRFFLDYNTYDQVSIFSGGMCAVGHEGLWTYVDVFGKSVDYGGYGQAGVHSFGGLAPVFIEEEGAYYIDLQGQKTVAALERYARFGLYTEEGVAAERTNGQYVYLDQNMEVQAGPYDYAGSLNLGIGAIRTGDTWRVVDSKGMLRWDVKYSDIKLDGKEICYRHDRLFAREGEGKYRLLDGKGNRVGNLEFEDAKVFVDADLTAVKMDGKWCFINREGERISDKNYEEAGAFSQGLAAVRIHGKWGYVDAQEKVCIEAEFDGAGDFNDKGSAFVKLGEGWQLLRLYRLNR